MKLVSDPRVKEVFSAYPPQVRKQMRALRKLVISTAKKTEGVVTLEETLKWGEPSYLTKHGSTIRMDWKEKAPQQYALYFKCTSKLVPTFKKLFKGTFEFEKNRAIVFSLDDVVPSDELARCIGMALSYHKRKNLPLLGETKS